MNGTIAAGMFLAVLAPSATGKTRHARSRVSSLLLSCSPALLLYRPATALTAARGDFGGT